MTEALVVIDVQPMFEGCDRIVEPCAELVGTAVKLGKLVFFVEYIGFGETARPVSIKTANYHRTYYIRKAQMSGGPKIHELCRQMGVQPEVFDVCGLYRNCCVLWTVKDLIMYFPEAEVRVQDYAVHDEDKALPDNWFFSHDRVKFIGYDLQVVP